MKADHESFAMASAVERVRFRAPAWWRKPVIYRFARAAHAYLSAFAFVGLMFFAATGFLLNHPDLLKVKTRSEQIETVSLSVDQVAAAMGEEDRGLALASLVATHADILGSYSSAEIFDDEAMLRFSGVKGDTDVVVRLASGVAEIETTRSGVISIIRELHRGKEAGAVWRFLIDVIAIVTLLLSAVGFFLFFTMKFRLATSLKFAGASLVVMSAIFIAFVA